VSVPPTNPKVESLGGTSARDGALLACTPWNVMLASVGFPSSAILSYCESKYEALSFSVTDIALGNLASISVTHSFSVTHGNIAKNYILWPTFLLQKVSVLHSSIV